MPGMPLALLLAARRVKTLRACAKAAQVSFIWPIFAILTGINSAPCTDSEFRAESAGEGMTNFSRVALVTGGGRGIGREAAQLLSQAGARVMVVSRSATELAAVGLEYVAADLGTAEGCALAVAETERRLGPIDVLVVNHGIGSAHERLVWEQDPEVWRQTMRINLDGPFELARRTVGGMCKRGFGRLVFTSSTAGEKAERSGSAYTASKHGVIGLARAIAQDAGPFGVTSNAVLPGWVRTAMAERSAKTEAERRGISVEQVWQERAAIYPQNRVLEPREVAQVIAFLCSDAAGGVNGEAITVALGGMC